MLNSHCNYCNNEHYKKCDRLDANPYCSNTHTDLESTMFSTRLRSPMKIFDKNICYVRQVVNRESAVSVNNDAFFSVAAY